MQNIYQLLMGLLMLGALIQPILFIFILGSLSLLRRRWESSSIPFSLFLSAGFFLCVGLLLAILGAFFPIFIILQIALMGLGLLAQKADRQLHWRSFPFAVLIYFFTVNQFEQVNLVKESEVVWEFPESGRPFLVHARLVSQKQYYWAFTNEKLFNYLPSRGIPTAMAKYTLTYFWGGLSAVQLDTVAGQSLQQDQQSQIRFFCENDCDRKDAFPKTYFMARGLDGRRPKNSISLYP